MKILIVEPGKAPRRADIEPELENLQDIVGGYIELVTPFEDPIGLVCNEEGLILELPFNRLVTPRMPIFGTFFLCGLGEEDFTDLPDELAEEYEKRLQQPMTQEHYSRRM